MKLISRLTCLYLLFVFQGFAQTTPEKPQTEKSSTDKTAAEKTTPEKPAPYLRQATISQTADVVHVTANSPRPLVQTLVALQLKYGWVVDYEDPQYISHLDFVEAPDAASGSRLPAGGSFNVEFPASSPDEEKTLRLVVDSYNQSKNPGRFEVRHGAQGNFRVVGTAAHDGKGAIAPQTVPFDVPVTLATQERTIIDTIDLICKAIAKQSHLTVNLGISPRKFLAFTKVKIGGSKVPARELLLQCLTATNKNLYWQLLFDPGSKAYVLNLHSAPTP